MSNLQRLQLGPDSAPLQPGRSAHGRWRVALQRAGAPPEGAEPRPAALILIQDSDRLAFAMTEGPAAEVLAERLADHLWTVESANGEWPENLRAWLADTPQWADSPAGKTSFIGGRLERAVAGGRIYLAWLGMSGVKLFSRADETLALDTTMTADEGWTPDHGPEPVGMALHAYRGGLFGLERLIAHSPGAEPLSDDLKDISNADLRQALVDWGEEAERDLAVFDLRLNPVLTMPNTVSVGYQWVSPEQVELVWKPSPNATAYRVEEASSPGFDDATLMADLTDGRQVHYQFSPPSTGTRYYRVTPLNQGVPGAPSGPINPTPLVLNPPTMRPIHWSSDGGYYVRWAPIPQATGYEAQTSDEPDFSPYESQIIYRGEQPETYLSFDTPPNRYYRARAINVFYAPHSPSPWSEAERSPARLDTPTFTRVSQKRLEWEPVPGARQYVIRAKMLGDDESGSEDFFTREPACGVADVGATYRVRALRHPDDERTASEWSETISISPLEEPARWGFLDPGRVTWVLLGVALVAALIGVALGVMGLGLYQDANATATRTPIPQEMLAGTNSAATEAAFNATAIQRTADFVHQQSATAAQWTETPTPTDTLTPSNTPNLTETLDVAFVVGLTSTAAQWTETPTPSDTLTPSFTPNLTETVDAAFVAAVVATEAAWTDTPMPSETPRPTVTLKPSPTPNLTETVGAAFVAALAATEAAWTAAPTLTKTPVPSRTPNLTGTLDAALAASLTAIAAQWTPMPLPSDTPNLTGTLDAALTASLTAIAAQWTATPAPTETPVPTPTPVPTATPDVAAMAEALVIEHLSAGCFVINLPDATLPVYGWPFLEDTIFMESVPRLSPVIERHDLPAESLDGTREIWLKIRVTTEGGEATGWVRAPEDVAEPDLYAGPDCPQP
jgi:hypothetical protein